MKKKNVLTLRESYVIERNIMIIWRNGKKKFNYKLKFKHRFKFKHNKDKDKDKDKDREDNSTHGH
jgi:ABC-type nickel/cobalt efflux system permease component RcnA